MILFIYTTSITPPEKIKKNTTLIITSIILIIIINSNTTTNIIRTKTQFMTYQTILPIIITILLTYTLIAIRKIIESPQNPTIIIKYENAKNKRHKKKPYQAPHPIKHLIHMKYRIHSIRMLRFTNHHRSNNLHTIFNKPIINIRTSNNNFTKHHYRLTTTNTTLPRSHFILRLYIHSHKTKPMNQFTQNKTKNMNYRNDHIITNYNNSIPRICTTMRTNIILRSHSNHKYTICNPIPRKKSRNMVVRKLLSQTTNPKSIFLLTFLNTNNNRNTIPNSPNKTTFNRIFYNHIKHNNNRKNYISPLFLSKRPHSITPNHLNINMNHHPYTLFYSGPGELHRSKSPIYTNTHSTRMVFPICICNPTNHPIKIRRSVSPNSINPSVHITNNNKKINKNNKIQTNQKTKTMINPSHPTNPNMNRSQPRRRPIRKDRTDNKNNLLSNNNASNKLFSK